MSVERGENHSSVEENYEIRNQHSSTATAAAAAAYTNMNIKDEEEEASLALLIEELKHKPEEDDLEQQPCNNNDNLVVSQSSDSYFERGGCSYNNMINTTPRRASSNMAGKGNISRKEVEDLQAINGFEDCFGGLDTLPEVSGFKFPLFDCLNNDRT